MSGDASLNFLLDYFRRRKDEFEMVVIKPKRTTSAAPRAKKCGKEKISLTPEELEILKKLGL
jgi:predicted DNA-binding protein (UPF0251 family)